MDMRYHFYRFFALGICALMACQAPEISEESELGAPAILSLSTTYGRRGDTLEIRARNFSKTAEKNRVRFGQYTAYAFETFINGFRVEIPGGESDPLVLEVYGRSTTSKDTFYVVDYQFDEVPPLPALYNAKLSFTVGGKGYVGFDNTYAGKKGTRFWSFDPSTFSWEEKLAFEKVADKYRINDVMVVGDEVYLFGINEIPNNPKFVTLLYDPILDEVEEVLLSIMYANGNFTAVGGKGYRIDTAIHAFDPATLSWSLFAQFPIDTTGFIHSFAFEDELVLVGGGSTWGGSGSSFFHCWGYRMSNQKWTLKRDLPYHPQYHYFNSFNNDKYGYLLNDDCLQYNSAIGFWEEVRLPYLFAQVGFSFPGSERVFIFNTSRSKGWVFDPDS